MSEHDLIDATVVNQIALRRYLAREIREMLKLFEEYDRHTARVLRRKYSESLLVGSVALKKLYDEIKELRTELMGKANRRARDMTKELAPAESEREWAMLLLLLLGGASESRAQPKVPTMADILASPFASGNLAAATYAEWLHKLHAADQVRVRDVLSRSVTESVPTNVVVERILGTKTLSYADGALARSRHNVTALLDTLVTHVSNFVRQHVWENTPEVAGAIWISILDRATTAICRSRDNKVVMFGNNKPPEGAVLLEPQGARPPAHVRCRSGMAPLRRGAALPSRRTFNDWIKAQPVWAQEDILGKAKAEMFRKGDVSLDQFVDFSGKEFTIKQLLSAA